MNSNFAENNHFIQEQMKRCDRNIFISNIGLLLVTVAIFLFGARYWYNFIFGPFPITAMELTEIQS
ncbi:hypothetical protein H6F32_07995 [Anabaena sp. FACHB-1237]|uniref:hypothetical protein n=1 Tax=Anabaena sp. FACHB-1237 TaxID=2692769 RepID=UPI001680AE83|nr:hypothetical protein [Anabaena sp. FACHB-1237]MBD2137525.1 hypothetical protein [Anabaena sp. FACHB-1237]